MKALGWYLLNRWTIVGLCLLFGAPIYQEVRGIHQSIWVFGICCLGAVLIIVGVSRGANRWAIDIIN